LDRDHFRDGFGLLLAELAPMNANLLEKRASPPKTLKEPQRMV
jgi:hypothetical protein